MWWLFTKPFKDPPKSLSVIMDDNGPYPIDDLYRDTGESEGWLIRTGYYYDHNDTLVWIFRIR